MGLSDSGIQQVRAAISELQANKNKLVEDLQQLQSSINSDSNFQQYVAGTDVGTRDNETILKIIEIANKSCDSTDGVIGRTNSFLDQQHQDNIRKAQLQAEAAQGGVQ